MGDSAKSELEHAPPDAQVEENAMNNPERIDLIPQPPSEGFENLPRNAGLHESHARQIRRTGQMSMPEFQTAWRVMKRLKPAWRDAAD